MTTLPWFGALLSDRREPALSTVFRASPSGTSNAMLHPAEAFSTTSSVPCGCNGMNARRYPFGMPVAAVSQRGCNRSRQRHTRTGGDMSRKQRGPGHRSNPSSSAGAAPDRFRTNVFTWTGPGIENIFIDFEPGESPSRRRLWKDGHPNSGAEALDWSDHNA